MARNYSMTEAVRIVREGTDKAALIDLGKKFPLTMYHLVKLDEAGLNFVSMLPEKITTRKIETTLRGDDVIDEDEENEMTETTKTVNDAPVPRSWKSMSQYQKTKARSYGAEYVAACKKLDEDETENEAKEKSVKKSSTKTIKKVEPEVDEDDNDDDEDEEEEVKPAKKAKKPEKKAVKKEEKKAKKPAKKVVEEEDNDDDFDDFDFDDDDDE